MRSCGGSMRAARDSILRWEALLLSALAMLPLSALLAVVFGAAPGLSVLAVVTGAGAALVQVLGLVRWPFAVPELARRYLAAPDGPEGDAARQTVTVVFATLHRLLGVGIGEHLGYLLTGLWTLLVAESDPDRTAVVPPRGSVSSVCRSGSRYSSARSNSSVRTSATAGTWPVHRAGRLHRLVDLAHRARGVLAHLTGQRFRSSRLSCHRESDPEAGGDDRSRNAPSSSTKRLDTADLAGAELFDRLHQ